MKKTRFLSLIGALLIWSTSSGQSTLKENLDLPYDAGSLHGDEEDEFTNLVYFYGQQYEGDGVFYCLDRSKSMENNGELNILKREVIRSIGEFSDRVQFGIVFFSTNTVRFPSNGLPAEATPGMKESAYAFVSCVNAGGATCAARALVESLKMANASTSKRSMVLFLTDGHLYCQGFEEKEYAAKTLRDVTQSNYKQVPIHCIGIGNDVDVKFLMDLAQANQGTFRQVNR